MHLTNKIAVPKVNQAVYRFSVWLFYVPGLYHELACNTGVHKKGGAVSGGGDKVATRFEQDQI